MERRQKKLGFVVQASTSHVTVQIRGSSNNLPPNTTYSRVWDRLGKMDDARALLRAERASRRITHPHASYTGDGKLLCNLCETLVKSEAQWQSHLHSTQHNLRSQRQQDVAASRGAGADGGAKKRKADSIESPPQERKKARAEPAPEPEEDMEAVVQDKPEVDTPEVLSQQPNGKANSKLKGSTDIDPSEILAFERELDALEAAAAREEEQARQEALRNAATISAAPMTAEQLAAQAREEQSAQRGRRDLELEEEREDAARVLEDEMEEMEGLEERVKRLRKRRERLREEGSPVAGTGTAVGESTVATGPDVTERLDGGEESSGEDDDEDIDGWKFGGN